MVINLYEELGRRPEEQEQAADNGRATTLAANDRSSSLSAAGSDNVDKARQYYEEVLRAHLNTRGGSLAMLRSRKGDKRQIMQRITNDLPMHVREARAALIYAYNAATVDKAPVSSHNLATSPPEHHEHHHDHHDELHAHDHDHEHETPGDHFARGVDSQLLHAIAEEKHKQEHEALHKLGVEQHEHGHNPYHPHGKN